MNNLVEFQILELKNINSPIKRLESKTLWELIMDMRVDDNDKVFVAVKKSQQDNHTLQAKKRYEEKASLHMLHLLAQLLHLYRKEVLTKLAPKV